MPGQCQSYKDTSLSLYHPGFGDCIKIMVTAINIRRLQKTRTAELFDNIIGFFF